MKLSAAFDNGGVRDSTVFSVALAINTVLEAPIYSYNA